MPGTSRSAVLQLLRPFAQLVEVLVEQHELVGAALPPAAAQVLRRPQEGLHAADRASAGRSRAITCSDETPRSASGFRLTVSWPRFSEAKPRVHADGRADARRPPGRAAARPPPPAAARAIAANEIVRVGDACCPGSARYPASAGSPSAPRCTARRSAPTVASVTSSISQRKRSAQPSVRA